MRDGSLLYSKLPSPGENPSEIKCLTKIKFANGKSICDLTAINNTIYSCSLDQSVRSWVFDTDLFKHRTYTVYAKLSLSIISQ